MHRECCDTALSLNLGCTMPEWEALDAVSAWAQWPAARAGYMSRMRVYSSLDIGVLARGSVSCRALLIRGGGVRMSVVV